MDLNNRASTGLAGFDKVIDSLRLGDNVVWQVDSLSEYRQVEHEGRKTFYVFDCLSDLLQYWNSDVMIGSFFKVSCPFLYELDTVGRKCTAAC